MNDPTQGPAETVVVVASEGLIRLAISQLRDFGNRVIEAETADEAILVLQQPRVRVGIVLADIRTPAPIKGSGQAQQAITRILAETLPKGMASSGPS